MKSVNSESFPIGFLMEFSPSAGQLLLLLNSLPPKKETIRCKSPPIRSEGFFLRWSHNLLDVETDALTDA